MNHDASIENALALIEAIQAAGAITSAQRETLTQAFSENAAKSPQQLFSASGLFDEIQIVTLSKALRLLNEDRISKQHLAIYVMSTLQAGKPLSTALDGLEQFAKAKPEETSVLPAVLQVYRKEVEPERMKELEKRLIESPQISWEEHIIPLDILKPRDFEIAKLGQSMIDRGEITKEKFAVALYDDLTGMCKFEESLQVRGWWPGSRSLT